MHTRLICLGGRLPSRDFHYRTNYSFISMTQLVSLLYCMKTSWLIANVVHMSKRVRLAHFSKTLLTNLLQPLQVALISQLALNIVKRLRLSKHIFILTFDNLIRQYHQKRYLASLGVKVHLLISASSLYIRFKRVRYAFNTIAFRCLYSNYCLRRTLFFLYCYRRFKSS